MIVTDPVEPSISIVAPSGMRLGADVRRLTGLAIPAPPSDLRIVAYCTERESRSGFGALNDSDNVGFAHRGSATRSA
jgi:hypothetical protein